jgi:fumarate reductase subunit C
VYTDYHPRWLRHRESTWWWLKKPAYFVFILREISSVFVAWGVVYLLFLVAALRQGEVAYGELLAWSKTPAALLLNVVSVFFVVFHAVTWFNLAPKAMVVHAGGRPVPGAVIAASNYAAWVVVSAAVVWLLVGG